jgi:hypothetical protein
MAAKVKKVSGFRLPVYRYYVIIDEALIKLPLRRSVQHFVRYLAIK